MERQQRIEREMSSRVVALLEPVVGSDRVRVNVAVKLNPQTSEETEERWDPNTVVRTRQTQADQATSAALGGLAGTRGNVPPDATPQAQNAAAAAPVAGTPGAGPTTVAGPASSRNAETTTYEVSRMTRHVVQPAGDIARLSVAVILDDDHVATTTDGETTVARKARTPEEIQKIQGIVAAAVGLEPDRGDLLTVENVAFDEPVVIEAPPPPFLERYSPQMWEGARILTVGALGILAFFMFVRPLMRRAGAAIPAVAAIPASAAAAAAAMPSARGPRTVAQLESEIDAQLDALTAQYAEERKLPVLTRRVSAVTVSEPESVAKLLRSWIQDPDR
jgi:flagellar M-ring protein FliF